MSKKDGGPAYPHDGIKDLGRSGTIAHKFPGMSLRDYFAAAAMAGLSGHDFFDKENKRVKPEGYAFVAYQLADAMLAARDAA